MNSNQNGAVLVKCSLALRFLMYLIYTPNWLQTLNIMQFAPLKRQFKPQIALKFSLLSLVSDLYNLTLNWSLNF
jgi:hypothetical protein